MNDYELIKHPKFIEFLSGMLLTLDKFYKLDEEMKKLIIRSFESWLRRVEESPPARAVIRCPYCGRPIEVQLTARSLA